MMNDDLVERLREGAHRICAYGGVSPCVTCAERTEAADEIEALRRDNANLKDQLRGIANNIDRMKL